MTSRRQRWLTQGALACGAVLMAFPFVWMVSTALKPPTQIFDGRLIPSDPTLANFTTVFHEIPVWRYYVNGTLVVAVIFALQVLIAVPAAYAIARLRFRGRDASLWLVLLCLMVPAQVTAIPIFLVFSRLGILDSYASLILPFAGSAFGIFLLRQFFLTLPASLFDAARLDGAGPLRTLTSVAMPLLRPALTSFAVFSVVSHWNDYFWPSIVLRTTEHATVPFGLVAFTSTEAGARYGPQMAMALLAIAPMAVGFLLAQRQFIEGIALSGLQD
jgi:multiple sugar transport system permease protein